VIVSAARPAVARAELISASTCVAAVPSWTAEAVGAAEALMVSDGAGTGPEVGRIAGAVLVVIPLEGAAMLADAAVFDGFGAAFLCLRAAPGVG
jgi:hypothetical protein